MGDYAISVIFKKIILCHKNTFSCANYFAIINLEGIWEKDMKKKNILSVLLLGLFTLLTSCGKEPLFSNPYHNEAHINQTIKILGNVARKLPEVKNEGLNRYPTYGEELKDITDKEKDDLLTEDAHLRCSDATYNSMDQDGNLYLNGQKTGQKLYKHSSASGMYYGDVDDNEKAVIEEITITPRPLGNHITGLYAPAGEVIKVEISAADLEKTGGLKIAIGQVSQNNQLNNIWKERNDFKRMPNIANIMEVKETTAYVGYYLGGPIYVTPNIASSPFTVKISGAVRYPYFIYGYTTKDEVEEMKSFSAPYFDFEIWDNAVRHSGPKLYGSFDYENLMNAGRLWSNIAKTSKQFYSTSNANIGITFVYDPFVAAGGAVAFVGRNWCNLPPSWMSGSLNYQEFTTNGAWGTIHEYNHHFQKYGFAQTDEVTNNAVSILSYINYTNISSNRTLNDSSLPDWNRFTDPSRSLRDTIAEYEKGSVQSSLNTYVDIIHTFGVDNFIKAALYSKGSVGVDKWYEALCETLHYDFTYYFEDILRQNVSSDLKATYQARNYPTFVPIASTYQVGRSYLYDNQEYFSETVKPFNIAYGQDYEIDLNKYIIVPKNVTFKVNKVENKSSSQLTKKADNIYVLSPNSKEKISQVNVNVTLEGNNIKTQDVTLVLKFKQAYLGMELTTYTYETMPYKTIQEALDANFENYQTKSETTTKSTFINQINPNMIANIKGKIYIEDAGKYRLCFRSDRGNNVLFTAINSNNLTKALDLTGSHLQWTDVGEHVLEYDLQKGDFIYFSEYTMSYGSFDAYMELGLAKVINDKANINGTIASKYLYNVNDDYHGYDFTFEEVYHKNYEITGLMADKSLQSIVSVENYTSWDDNYKIENIIDGNSNTAFHSQQNKMITTEPFKVTIDLGQEMLCDSLYITGYNKDQMHMPTEFKLYGGTSLDNMPLLLETTNHPFENKKLVASFKTTMIRYYTLEVTNTDTSRYVAMSEIDMGIAINGHEVSLDEASYFGDFKVIRDEVISSYGHTIKGKGTIKFSFEGSKFALKTLCDSDCQFKIKIDGKNVDKIKLTKTNDFKIVYLNNSLENKKHDVEIIVQSNNINIDSFIVG